MTEKLYSRMRIVRILSLVLLFMSVTTGAFAQSKTIKGTVKDATGNPVIGATVLVPGTTNGVTTDVNGNYTITVPASARSLQFSYIGYENAEQAISGDILNATLRDTALEVDEVVVIGYGTTRRGDLTGSVSSVSSKVLESIPVNSTAEAITGRMAGVQITTTEGSPDAEIKIRIRGGGSVTQDNSPLYIVDGFPVNSISDVAPSDIASIDVLKDASSSAIYGARGANGVVIITTKSGAEGRVNVNFNAYWGTKKITRKLDMLDPYEYVLWQYEIAKRGVTNEDPAAELSSSVKSFEKYYGSFSDIDLYKNVQGYDWQEEVFGRSALQQYYNLGVSGGTKSLKYNLGFTRNDEEGIMIGSGFVRNNITAKLNGNISKKFSFDFNTRFSHTVIDGAGVSSNSSDSKLKNTIKYAPVDALVSFDEDDENNSETNPSIYLDPVRSTYDEYKQVTRTLQTYNAAINYKIIPQLTFRTEWGIEIGNQRTDRFYGSETSLARNNKGNPIVQIGTRESQSLRTANTLTYDATGLFGGNHNLNVMLGQEATSYFYKTIDLDVRDFAKGTSRNEALAMIDLGAPYTNSSFESPDNNQLSFFGRVNYAAYNKYLATVVMRADGSSKFAKGNQWGYFPSAALAWRISEEGFMANTKEWMYNLKLRLSYGASGNNRIDDDLWRSLYSADVPSGKYYYIDNNPVSHLIPNSSMPNPEIKWETTITRNIGIDAGFFKGRLNATLDVYLNTTKDLLLNANIPTDNGYSVQMQNIGKTSNRGIELTLDGVIVQQKDFMLSGSFNIAFNRNKIDELGDTKTFTASSYWFSGGKTPDADYWIEEGRSIGLIYGYVTDGMYSFDDFTFNDGTRKWELNPDVPDNTTVAGHGTSFAPGALKFKKTTQDADMVIDGDDRIVIGNTNPKHTGGFSLSASWKGFDASAFFNWVYGNDVYNANKIEFSCFPDTKSYGNILDIMNSKKRFSYVDSNTGLSLLGDPAALAAYNQGATIWSPLMTSVPVHSWCVEDGSFLRLNNVTIGYTLPQHITRKFSVQKLRVYVTGYNLHTWTNYSGYDPEVDARRSTPLTPGVDYSAFPKTRSFVAGVNVTF